MSPELALASSRSGLCALNQTLTSCIEEARGTILAASKYPLTAWGDISTCVS